MSLPEVLFPRQDRFTTVTKHNKITDFINTILKPTLVSPELWKRDMNHMKRNLWSENYIMSRMVGYINWDHKRNGDTLMDKAHDRLHETLPRQLNEPCE
jgi:hypothetical protein